ncbi:MAG: hypothetical protein WCY21_04260 [Candidatus Cloacimonadaceae bacterium]|nr:hypothetical protein [Candidatus Cloacimonadota bacterium]MDX9949436.1 hypothetical protein [Candidatus Syntrophosphaera sp.]NLN85959.1 hypothetical protein [Candidatus Cloacimonadota bacterium]
MKNYPLQTKLQACFVLSPPLSQIHLAQCPFDHLNPANHHPTPRPCVILSASDRLAGTPDSSGRRCQIHLAQCPFDHSDSAHHHPNPPRSVILSEAKNPAHAGAPDSSGRRCQIHLAQCPADHPAPPTTQTRPEASFRTK